MTAVMPGYPEPRHSETCSRIWLMNVLGVRRSAVQLSPGRVSWAPATFFLGWAMGMKKEDSRRPSTIVLVMPSSSKWKWRVGSRYGELRIGFSMTSANPCPRGRGDAPSDGALPSPPAFRQSPAYRAACQVVWRRRTSRGTDVAHLIDLRALTTPVLNGSGEMATRRRSIGWRASLAHGAAMRHKIFGVVRASGR